MSYVIEGAGQRRRAFTLGGDTAVPELRGARYGEPFPSANALVLATIAPSPSAAVDVPALGPDPVSDCLDRPLDAEQS
jgi:hypothetical protein